MTPAIMESEPALVGQYVRGVISGKLARDPDFEHKHAHALGLECFQQTGHPNLPSSAYPAHKRAALIDLALFDDAADDTPPPPALADAVAKADRESAALASIPRIEFLDLDAIAEHGIPEPDYMVPALKIVRGEVVLVSGIAGGGKTSTFAGLSVAYASRTPFLGQPTFAREGESVIYVDAEGAGAAATSELFLRFGAKGIQNLHVTSDPDLCLVDPAAVARLELAIVEKRAALVVLDTFSGIARGIDENSAGETGRIYATLQRLRDRHGCTFVVLHHLNKAGRDGASVHPLERIRGSSVHSTAPSLVIYAESVLGGGALDLSAYKARGRKKGPLARVELVEQEGGMLSLQDIGIPGPSTPFKADQLATALLDAFPPFGRIIRRRDLIAAVGTDGANGKRVSEALSDLASQGLVEPVKGKQGFWTRSAGDLLRNGGRK